MTAILLSNSTSIFFLQFEEQGKEERRASEVLSELSEKVLECNPILESFGNAKTEMNDNSSRFGKFTRIHFDSRNWLVGADIVTYLLEKSRVTAHSACERNYHCFYHLFAGLTTGEKAELKLTNVHDYRFLADESGYESSTAQYTEMVLAMRTVGVTVQQQYGLFSTLAALLHLGNVVFDETEDDSCQIAETGEATGASGPCKAAAPPARRLSVAALASLLRVGVCDLEEALSSRTMTSMSKSVYKIPLKVHEARFSCDSLAKAVYARVFDWLVSWINNSLLTHTQTRAFIGVLDIFGFEQFQTNSFEQLCINFANEKLQARLTLSFCPHVTPRLFPHECIT